MATVIIGAGTTVNFGGACVISANWSTNPNTQRLYCLGSWTPYDELNKTTQAVNLTIYAPGPIYSVAASQACEDVQDYSISVSPASCGDSLPGGISGNFAVNSYSYSKDDPNAPGQESWGFTRWLSTGGSIVPDYVIRGICEGSATVPVADTGIVFNGTTTEGSQGSVSAGATGIASVTYYGVISSIGGGTSAKGKRGNGSASIPVTPLWI